MKRSHNWFIFLLSLVMALVAAIPAAIPAKATPGPRCYVDTIATGANTGDSWTDAYPDLTAALSDLTCTEIWVAAGVYQPGGVGRAVTFPLKTGVAVYGGFAGGETFLSERDWKTNVTILSGDIDNDDTNTDGNDIAESTADIVGSNSYHVVTGSGTDSTAILDGFVITGGQANGVSHLYGGGMYNATGDPTLNNLVFSGNFALSGGGAIYNTGSDPSITNSAFLSNATDGYGGAINNYAYSDPDLTNVVFSGNTSLSDGGAMRNLDSWPTLTNVTFGGNTAGDLGGAVYNGSTGTVTIKNTIMWGNTAGSAGHNIYNTGVTVNISYSNIGGCGGSGGGWVAACGTDVGSNIDTDPFFIGEYDNLRLGFGSPSIETGTNIGCPLTDLDGLPRPVDANADATATCDMGAYEAGSMVCSVALGGPYTFYGQFGVEINVDVLGNLACLYVDEMGLNHPNATGTPGNNGIATGKYWLIRGLQSNQSTDASGFEVTLTLPHDLPNPKVCKYPGGLGGAGWDCDAHASTISSVTRSGITAFSDWAVGSEVGPTAVTLLHTAVQANNPAALPIGMLALLLAGISGTAVFYQRRRRTRS
jgi:predicted outer membrane repeat protein